jgi:hypothetical protein
MTCAVETQRSRRAPEVRPEMSATRMLGAGRSAAIRTHVTSTTAQTSRTNANEYMASP